MFDTLINKLIENNKRIICSVVCLISMILSYLHLFIILPLNPDTTGTYVVGRNTYTYLSYRSSIETGRWAKGIVELIIEKLGYYNIVPAFLFILLIIVCMYFMYNLTELFSFNYIIFSLMISSIFFITPAFISLFTYFQDLYAHILSIFLFALIIKYCFIGKKWIAYCILLTIMIGLYQAYINLVCSLFIIYCIYQLINNKIDKKRIKNFLFEVLKFIIYSIFAVILYYLLFKIFLKVYNLDSIIANRFGITFSVDNIVHSFAKMYGMVLILPFKSYAGLNTTLLIKVVFLVCLILSILSIINYIINHSIKECLTLNLLVFLLPVSMNTITLASSHIVIRMTLGLGSIYLFFAVIMDFFIKNVSFRYYKTNLVIYSLLLIIIFHMIYFSNGFIYMSRLVSESTKMFTCDLVSKIKKVDNYSNKKVYLHGSINDDNLTDYYVYCDYNIFPIDIPHNFLLFPWEYKEAINRFAAFTYNEPNPKEIDDILNTNDYRSMNFYPNIGSIKEINDIIVVKFSD